MLKVLFTNMMTKGVIPSQEAWNIQSSDHFVVSTQCSWCYITMVAMILTGHMFHKVETIKTSNWAIQLSLFTVTAYIH